MCAFYSELPLCGRFICCLCHWGGWISVSLWLEEGRRALLLWFLIQKYPGFIVDRSEFCTWKIPKNFGCLPTISAHLQCVQKTNPAPGYTQGLSLIKQVLEFLFLWITQFNTQTVLPRKTTASVVSASAPKRQIFTSTLSPKNTFICCIQAISIRKDALKEM